MHARFTPQTRTFGTTIAGRIIDSTRISIECYRFMYCVCACDICALESLFAFCMPIYASSSGAATFRLAVGRPYSVRSLVHYLIQVDQYNCTVIIPAHLLCDALNTYWYECSHCCYMYVRICTSLCWSCSIFVYTRLRAFSSFALKQTIMQMNMCGDMCHISNAVRRTHTHTLTHPLIASIFVRNAQKLARAHTR